MQVYTHKSAHLKIKVVFLVINLKTITLSAPQSFSSRLALLLLIPDFYII
jgi:hypothetical protein